MHTHNCEPTSSPPCIFPQWDISAAETSGSSLYNSLFMEEEISAQRKRNDLPGATGINGTD